MKNQKQLCHKTRVGWEGRVWTRGTDSEPTAVWTSCHCVKLLFYSHCVTNSTRLALKQAQNKPQHQCADPVWAHFVCIELLLSLSSFSARKHTSTLVGLSPPKWNPAHVGAGQTLAQPWRTSKYWTPAVGGRGVGVVHLRSMSHPVLVCLGPSKGAGLWVQGQGSALPRLPQGVAVVRSHWHKCLVWMWPNWNQRRSLEAAAKQERNDEPWLKVKESDKRWVQNPFFLKFSSHVETLKHLLSQICCIFVNANQI